MSHYLYRTPSDYICPGTASRKSIHPRISSFMAFLKRYNHGSTLPESLHLSTSLEHHARSLSCFSSHLMTVYTARFERFSSGKVSSEGGEGCRVEIWRTSGYGKNSDVAVGN